jgi:4-amino-4-deoxy-L-arabinose transferase-like glycosyltransferase
MEPNEPDVAEVPEQAVRVPPAAEPAPPAAVLRTASRALWHLCLVVPLAAAVFFFQLGVADFRDDSGANGAQVVQELVAGEGWILPLRNGQHLPVKPPLFYWMGAASALARGTTGDIWDSRAPSAVLGVLGVVAVYLFARGLAGERVALWSALVLITTPQFVIEAKNSRVDIALAVFLTIGLFLAYRVLEGAGGRKTAALAGLCFGLAVLSKGPLALALVGIVLLPTLLVNRPAPGWNALFSPWVVLGAVGLPALWYAAATAVHGMAFLRLQLYVENVARLEGKLGHWPWWFYAEPLMTAGLPWMLALPLVIFGRSTLPRRSRVFLWLWVGMMLLLFSLSPGKRRAYLLPLRPPLAILTAGWLVALLDRRQAVPRAAQPPLSAHVASLAVVVVGLLVILALRAGVGGFGAQEAAASHWWREYFEQHVGAAMAMVIGIGVGVELMLLALWQRRFEMALFVFTGMVAVGLTVGVAAGEIVRGEGGTFRLFAAEVTRDVPRDVPLRFFTCDDTSLIALLFHLRRHVPTALPPDPAAPCVPPGNGYYLVPEAHWDADACFRHPHWQLVARGGPRVASQRDRRMVLARFVGAPPGRTL